MQTIYPYIYKNQKIGYCNTCDCWYVLCEHCGNSSCNGGGCDKCCGKTEDTNFSIMFNKEYDIITKDWLR